MTAFRDQTFATRFHQMGDKAEQKFQEVYDKGWIEWGLRRPPIQVSSLPQKIRYAPDFLTSDGFIEVMGVGQDQLLKLKHEKYVALLLWNQEMPTRLFIWDSKNKRHTLLKLSDIEACITSGVAKAGSFPEGKAIWEIDLEDLGAEWAST